DSGGRSGQRARGDLPARSARSDPVAARLGKPLPRSAHTRRGAPLRDYVPPRRARQEEPALGTGRRARRWTEAEARAVARFWLGAGQQGRDYRRDCRRPRHDPPQRRRPEGAALTGSKNTWGAPLAHPRYFGFRWEF